MAHKKNMIVPDPFYNYGIGASSSPQNDSGNYLGPVEQRESKCLGSTAFGVLGFRI